MQEETKTQPLSEETLRGTIVRILNLNDTEALTPEEFVNAAMEAVRRSAEAEFRVGFNNKRVLRVVGNGVFVGYGETDIERIAHVLQARSKSVRERQRAAKAAKPTQSRGRQKR